MVIYDILELHIKRLHRYRELLHYRVTDDHGFRLIHWPIRISFVHPVELELSGFCLFNIDDIPYSLK